MGSRAPVSNPRPQALAAIAGLPLLAADLGRGLAAAPDFSEWLRLLFREAWLLDGVLYLDGIDAVRAPSTPQPGEPSWRHSTRTTG